MHSRYPYKPHVAVSGHSNGLFTQILRPLYPESGHWGGIVGLMFVGLGLRQNTIVQKVTATQTLVVDYTSTFGRRCFWRNER